MLIDAKMTVILSRLGSATNLGGSSRIFNGFHSSSRILASNFLRRGSETLKLAYTSFESTTSTNTDVEAPPIIIQHGLLGSRKNWNSLGKVIHSKTGRKVVIADARNHGDSPHCDQMDYQLLAKDVVQLMEDLEISKATLIGHSMGGRTMMAIALMEPSLVDSLVVVDISPVDVSPGAGTMRHFLDAMESVKLQDKIPRSVARKIVDEQLQTVVKDQVLRQFLLTNLVEHDGSFKWRVNLKAIINNLHHIIGKFPFESIYSGPTLFVGGQLSDYIKPNQHSLIRQKFPRAQFDYVAGAGHWVHSEKPAEFLEIVLKFLRNSPSGHK